MFNLLLKTKPYVHQFLISNFGDPVDLSADPRLYSLFRRCLRKPCARRQSTYSQLKLLKYNVDTMIIIPEDDFYRHGWEMSKEDTIAFGREVENRAKFVMRSIVSMYTAYMSTKDAILRFQERFGYTDDTWSFDSIKQDFFRNGVSIHHDLQNEVVEKIETIFLDNLSDLGTICPQYITNYDKHKQNARSAVGISKVNRHSASKPIKHKRRNSLCTK